MKIKGTAALLCFTVFLAVLLPALACAEATRVRVSAHAAITEGDVAGAQNEALKNALEKSVEKVLGMIIPERTQHVLDPLLRERVMPRTELFITNYQIVNQDVSDLAYTVNLSVTVATDMLRKDLAKLGIIKEPGSPPLTAQFVTVDAPLGLDHVKTLGSVALKSIGAELRRRNLTVIPVSEDNELGFRAIRPPQTAEALMSEGSFALADLAVGVIFQVNGETTVSGNAMTIPMGVSLQAVDVQTGALLGTTDIQETEVRMGTKDGTLLSKDLDKLLDQEVKRLSSALSEHYHVAAEARLPFKLVFEGSHGSQSVRNVLGELLFRLNESVSVIPDRFTEGRSVYTIWSDGKKDDLMNVLLSTRSVSDGFNVLEFEEGVILTGKTRSNLQGVREFGEEVTYYRRLPVPGVENPDDIRKIEYVGWQEQEYNSDVSSANEAPLGMGILGRIDPSRDHDVYRFRLPEGTKSITVLVEQTGPGEVQPLIRIFTGNGGLIAEEMAKSRGRNVYFTVALEAGTSELLLSIEDHLGRYPSMFPYVLTLTVPESSERNEPS